MPPRGFLEGSLWSDKWSYRTNAKWLLTSGSGILAETVPNAHVLSLINSWA